MVQNGFRHYEVDRRSVMMADSPSVTSATGFQDSISKAAQNAGDCYQTIRVTFDQEDGLHGHLCLSKQEIRAGGIAFHGEPDDTG
ncbi:MAG: hypothetical protein LAP39_23865 [Acidobacteriia bacterium]|nr:hypothetical protein [Terriglobia bacterium]